MTPDAPGTTLFHCLLCDWTHALPPMTGDEIHAAFLVGRSVTSIVLGHQMPAENAVADHLATHTTLEWATEVSRLRDELARARTVPRKPILTDAGMAYLNLQLEGTGMQVTDLGPINEPGLYATEFDATGNYVGLRKIAER